MATIYIQHNYYWCPGGIRNQGTPSQYQKRRLIVRSREVSKPRDFVFRISRSLWNLTDTSAALLPMCLSNFKAIRQFKVPISWLRDFTRSYEKTSFRILRQGPVHQQPKFWPSSSGIPQSQYQKLLLIPYFARQHPGASSTRRPFNISFRIHTLYIIWNITHR